MKEYEAVVPVKLRRSCQLQLAAKTGVARGRARRSAKRDEVRLTREHVRPITGFMSDQPSPHIGRPMVRNVGIIQAQHIQRRQLRRIRYAAGVDHGNQGASFTKCIVQKTTELQATFDGAPARLERIARCDSRKGLTSSGEQIL